jgi:hypothetical protein
METENVPYPTNCHHKPELLVFGTLRTGKVPLSSIWMVDFSSPVILAGLFLFCNLGLLYKQTTSQPHHAGALFVQ